MGCGCRKAELDGSTAARAAAHHLRIASALLRRAGPDACADALALLAEAARLLPDPPTGPGNRPPAGQHGP